MGLLVPFVRDRQRDFAAGSGDALLMSKVRQVLLTEPGELRWRTNFGAGLDRLRHAPNDDVLVEYGRVLISDALRRWLPSVRLLGVKAERGGSRFGLVIRVAQGPAVATVFAELDP